MKSKVNFTFRIFHYFFLMLWSKTIRNKCVFSIKFFDRIRRIRFFFLAAAAAAAATGSRPHVVFRFTLWAIAVNLRWIPSDHKETWAIIKWNLFPLFTWVDKNYHLGIFGISWIIILWARIKVENSRLVIRKSAMKDFTQRKKRKYYNLLADRK